MLLYKLQKLNGNFTNGKWYATPLITQTIDLDGLAEHMANHNTPYSKGAIKGILTDMVTCVKELTLSGNSVKIPDLAIFSIGFHCTGAKTEDDFSVTKNITGFRLRARGTGEFSAQSINLEASLKKANDLLGTTTSSSSSSDDNTGEE